jgi:IS1 family transposase/transposase-like protein
MVCHNCKIEAKKHGRDRKGNRRFRCVTCSKTFIEPQDKLLGNMYLPVEKAFAVLNLLAEGCSIRSTERITNVNRNTIMSLIVFVGERCERLLEDKVQNVAVRDVQADELWSFVQCKEKTKTRNGKDDVRIGDAYCFVAFERHTKLVLTWHLGRRTEADTIAFTEKLANATAGSFQMTTDGFKPYQHAVVMSLGTQRIDFAQLVKVYGASHDGEQRYSPAKIISSASIPIYGNPDPERICTSHVERQNLTIRMQMRRLTRLTNGFSKKWENLKAAFAFFFAYYDFCRVHSSIRVTPAMEAGITDHIWSLAELLAA